ncbi:ABC-type polysaccharide/polyol phosphate export system, permease component [Frankia torreyi]|uniref:Transport permease protein n=2 Tax=Frankia TaxID=1854 RepID=A0A0D8BHQ6_9ACTN|nr:MULTISPECIES: ABC transporter permease [Frankia]KJE23676.1 ABC-type polysaccharide/polyol phosphate export system, permease component [Frankia torreyi]KQM05712.1 ABC-type polysaccharide/polyol phosphate export system, permease component [Frankia sp. CpI1-P]
MSELALPKAAVRPAPRPAFVDAAGDAATMIGRSLRLTVRSVDGMITALALPIMLMLMFVYLFGGALQTGIDYVDYVVPGVLLVCAGFGAATTAVTVSSDLTTGVIDRFRSMDVSGAALISGHVVASVVRNLVSTALVVAVALAIGFRPSAGVGDWLVAVGVLALFVLALSWLSATVGILAGSPEAANGFTFLVSFLAYPSSAFVPVDTMPSWLRGFARDQPVNTVVETTRAALTGRPVGSVAWHAVLWSLGIIAVSVVASSVLFNRRTR